MIKNENQAFMETFMSRSVPWGTSDVAEMMPDIYLSTISEHPDLSAPMSDARNGRNIA